MERLADISQIRRKCDRLPTVFSRRPPHHLLPSPLGFPHGKFFFTAPVPRNPILRGWFGLWPLNGNPTRQRGSSGVMVDYISHSSRGLSVYLAVGITQSVCVDDQACTAMPPSRFGLPMMWCGLWPLNGNPTRQRGSSGVMVDYISHSSRGLSVYLAVGITQSVLMSDQACTAMPPSRFELPMM